MLMPELSANAFDDPAPSFSRPGSPGCLQPERDAAMLRLLTSPCWAGESQAQQPLPPTVPGALLVVLAGAGTWVDRHALAAVFWPDDEPADALHHLRINLHRSRQLLASWGVSDGLKAERSRVILTLATDVAALRTAQAEVNAATLAKLSPAQWLHGWKLPGYEGFSTWCDDTGHRLQADWLAAHRRSTAVVAPPRPGATSAPEAPVPPGREPQLHRLLASPAPALLLLGEPGAGKTTLLRAAFPNAPCMRGLQGLNGMPYRPLLDTLREHLTILQRALREPGHPLRPYRLDLARMLPELAPDEALPPLDALSAQARQVEALARAVEALTPVLLVDDLQWCDGATIDWLLLLAHSGRMRWRAAARRHELPRSLAQALQTLGSAGRLEHLDVPELSRQGVAQACAARWPDQMFSDAQLDRLNALSGGNPFLLGEWVEAGYSGDEDTASQPVMARVARLVNERLRGLNTTARSAVEAAAVYVQPVPIAALRAPIDAHGDVGAEVAEAGGDDAWTHVCAQARAAGLLQEDARGLSCRHDLIRQAVFDSLSPQRLVALNRHAALWLAERRDADALTIAAHWRAARELQTALAWCHRGAEQLKQRGRFDAARTLWREVADDSLDAAQSLRARLELAACDLFEDLSRGQTALVAVQAQLGAVADPDLHRQIEGRLLSALVDNRVFAGDIGAARTAGQRLRVLLPLLPTQERIEATEALIELAMREPDIPGAWGLLAQLRATAPQRPTLLSFEGQIHWFGGQVQAAHDALARLLERHPDYCRGITVENDLAVMLQALGENAAAEGMARRSLESWAGVAHTETLSLLVLGLVLTTAGRCTEAEGVLQRALHLAREQSSEGFEAEALVRSARLQLQCGRFDAAQQALTLAAPLLQHSPEPLRVSQVALAQVLVAIALKQSPSSPHVVDGLARIDAASARSEHPLVHVRAARARSALALAQGDAEAATAAARTQADWARRGGLKEALADAWLLQVRARQLAGELPPVLKPLVEQALAMAETQGFADLRWRAAQWLAVFDTTANAHTARAQAALNQLLGAEATPLFDAAAAARMEPGWH
ncbi:MAG: hypothetical protein AD742_10950 [Methylibium sp. NZG]|nr:MAG: hypothetical protein AD742_10950 [Methylibium sp. NZG]